MADNNNSLNEELDYEYMLMSSDDKNKSDANDAIKRPYSEKHENKTATKPAVDKHRKMKEEIAKWKELEKKLEKLTQLQRNLFKKVNKESSPGLKSLEELVEIDNRSIYVGNVDYGASTDELEELFSCCASINRVTIRTNKYDGHPKGFAYIEFKDKCSVETAIPLNEAVFRERQIKAMPKRTNRPELSTTNRLPRGLGAFRGSRRIARVFPSPYEWRPIRQLRTGRHGLCVPY